MSRGPHAVNEGYVAKVIAAALKAGLPVARVEVSPRDGRIIVIAGKPEEEQSSESENNEWDSVR